MKIWLFFYFDRAIARTANEPPGSRAVVHCSSPKSFDQQPPLTYNTHPSKGNSASAFPAPAPSSQANSASAFAPLRAKISLLHNCNLPHILLYSTHGCYHNGRRLVLQQRVAECQWHSFCNDRSETETCDPLIT